MPPRTPPALPACAAQVYGKARGAFLAGQLVQADRREAFYAVILLQFELGQVRLQTRDPLLGQMRLHWWQDKLAALAGDTAPTHYDHPILAQLVESGAQLPTALVEAMLQADAVGLQGVPADSLDGLLAWAQQWGYARLLLLAAQLAPITDALRQIAEPAGLVLGIVQLLQQASALAQEEASHPHDQLSQAVGQLRIAAQAALAQVAPLLPTIPRPQRPALFGLIRSQLLLRQLAKAGDQPQHMNWNRPDPWRAWRLYRLVQHGKLGGKIA